MDEFEAPKIQGCSDKHCWLVDNSVGTNGGCNCLRNINPAIARQIKHRISELKSRQPHPAIKAVYEKYNSPQKNCSTCAYDDGNGCFCDGEPNFTGWEADDPNIKELWQAIKKAVEG